MREQDLELLRERLEEIKEMGWIRNRRPGNIGGVGNTLEDLLDVKENNVQLPDFRSWELKSQRAKTKALITLFHSEPLPKNISIVEQILLPKYGWPHKQAGIRYPKSERSFRQTISTVAYSNRGFTVDVDRAQERIVVSFDFGMIESQHAEWRESVRARAGTGDLHPNPYWTFADISKKLQTKLKNLMYVQAETKRVNGEEHYKYKKFEAYVDPTLDKFLELMERGDIFVDFDARTGHNHGTKFRIRQDAKTKLYQQHIKV